MNAAQLIERLRTLPGDAIVCLDCLRCGTTVIGDIAVITESESHVEGTVWLAEVQ